MTIFHPNKKKLARWLNGEVLPKVEQHVSKCEQCADRLERIDAEDSPAITQALALALSPPDDLVSHMEEKVASRVESQMLDMVVDLYGAGFETSRILLTEETGDTR